MEKVTHPIKRDPGGFGDKKKKNIKKTQGRALLKQLAGKSQALQATAALGS